MSISLKERDFYFAFAYSDLFGTKRIEEITKIFGSLEKAWQAPENCWPKGLPAGALNKFFKFKKIFKVSEAKKYLIYNKLNFKIFPDPSYPNLLKNISSPPPIIFYRGDLKIIEEKTSCSLAIVGSRLTTTYGQNALKDLMLGLDERFLIVSGLALGTDTNAHRQALSQNLKTGAVLGGPLDTEGFSCPASNYWLAQEILQNGGFLISEFPPGSIITKSNYPRRNRIIAGLCAGTLVVEAGKKSGAIITAEYARDANRVVMAVPGSIYNEQSVGTNNLLKNYVEPVSETADIYRCFNLQSQNSKIKQKNHEKSLIEKANSCAGEKGILVLKALATLKIPANTNQISNLAMLDTPCVHSTLTILELSGIIRRSGDGQFSLV